MNNTKVLRLFLDNPLKKYSKREVCEALDLSRTGAHWAMVDLLLQRMIVEEKGRPNLYRLHKDLMG